jgi:phosphatidylethanolamine-binding protein
MISLSLFVSLAILPFVAAQTSDPGLEVKAIQAHFSGSGITPSLLPTFDPSAVLSVTFGSTAITPGQPLTQDRKLNAYIASYAMLTSTAQRSRQLRPSL